MGLPEGSSWGLLELCCRSVFRMELTLLPPPPSSSSLEYQLPGSPGRETEKAVSPQRLPQKPLQEATIDKKGKTISAD